MYVTVNGVNIYYECLGEGKEVLFIPGNGTSFKYMLRLAKLLAREYKVYLIDRRGQGKSTKSCELSYDLNVQDIYEFIQCLNISKPYIIGHSGGATITMILLEKYDNIADKIVLCSGFTNNEVVNSKYIKQWKLYSKFGFINSNILNMVLEAIDITQSLKKIKVKTLVLAGQKDIINKENTQIIVNNIPNATIKIYAKENHSSYIVRVKCYEDILDFLHE